MTISWAQKIKCGIQSHIEVRPSLPYGEAIVISIYDGRDEPTAGIVIERHQVDDLIKALLDVRIKS